MILKSGNDVADVRLQLWEDDDLLTEDDSYEFLQEDWMELIDDEEYESPVYTVDSVVSCIDTLADFAFRQNDIYEETNIPYEVVVEVNILMKGKELTKWKVQN